MPEVSETDFAIVVFREDDGWNADVLPVAVTDDLNGFIRALRQQPSIAGTIGLAGIDDYFFVADPDDRQPGLGAALRHRRGA